MKELIADLRNRIISCQSLIKLVAKGKKKETSALMEIATELMEMDKLCRSILVNKS